MGDHYQTLGLGRDASTADIKNAFFRLAHRHHPDHHTHADAGARAEAARRFCLVKDAYDVLYDERRRAEYDSAFRSSSSSSSSSGLSRYGRRHGHGHGGNSSSSSSANDHGHRHRGGTSSSSSSANDHGHRHRGGTSSSSWSAHDHGHGRGHSGATSSGSRAPPRPRGGSKIGNVIFCAMIGIAVLEAIAESWEGDQEKMEQDLEMMKMQRKQQWENFKREWGQKNPWKSWMESREKEKKKNWWTGIFRS